MSLAKQIAEYPVLIRRLIAIVLSLTTIFAIWQGGILPLRAVLLSQQHWRDRARAKLASARGLASEAPILKSRLDILRRSPIWNKFYPDGNLYDADNMLRQDVIHYAAAVDAPLRSISPLPIKTHSTFSRVGVQISTVMNITQLQEFLHSLRSSSHYLRVEALGVIAPQLQSVKDKNYKLLVHATIYAYVNRTAAHSS